MKKRLLLASIVLISVATLLFGGGKQVLPQSELLEREFVPDYTKPGGVVIGPALPRAFHYGGRHSVRDTSGIMHVSWEDPTYQFHYYARSIDTLGYSWTTPVNPLDAVGKTVDRALMAKMALDPVTNYIYTMPFYRENPGERYKTGISRSTDGGATWSPYMDLGAKIGRSVEEVSWGTFDIGSDQILHITYSKDNQDMMYTRANLAGVTNLADLVFTHADGIELGDEPVSYVPSGVVFQGTMVLDRNNDPHIIFSGDGGSDTFGDKTPYHIYYKSEVGGWGPIPPQQLMEELEYSWGMPEMVFDQNNRGYYFLDKNKPYGAATFGTWEPPVEPASTVDFGTLNGTNEVRGFGAALDLITDNYPDLPFDPASNDEDELYLPQADVDDVNDKVYLIANTNSFSDGNGGDIVVLVLENASTYAHNEGPDVMDWQVYRWITDDGIDLGDVGADVIYNPGSSKLDIFWSGSGPATNEAQYFPAHVPPADVDAQALRVFIDIPGDKEDVNNGDVITINGVVKNNGKEFLPPLDVTARIIDVANDETLFTGEYTAPPLSAGLPSSVIEFGTWTVNKARVNLSLTLSVTTPDDELPFNDVVGTSFFVYPNEDGAVGESFEDPDYTNFTTLTPNDTIVRYVAGDWYPAVTNTGGWSVIDSTQGKIAAEDPRSKYISSWILGVDEDEVNALVRHLQGVRGDTLFGDIALGELSDSLYAQPQNEQLLSPFYTLKATGPYSIEWDDNIDGTDGEFNFPIAAKVDVTIDGGATWDEVYYRIDTEGEATDINALPAYVTFDVTDLVTGADSVQFRFWWTNPNNDGSFATWEIDNVYFVGADTLNPQANKPVRSLPQAYELRQNYPNPFNPTSTIVYSVPRKSHVAIKVYDLTGREVMKLVNGEVLAGTHKVSFNGRNLASGVYFYTLESEGFVATKKMLLLK